MWTLHWESYYGESVRHLNVRIGKHIGISPLPKKQVKPKISSVADHLLFCNHLASYDDFSILRPENYIGTIVPIQQVLVVRFLLELYLFWIVVTLFLLNGVFMFLSCVVSA